MNKYLKLILIIGFTFTTLGCSKVNNINTLNKTVTTSSDEVIVSGVISEITDNNFIEGVYRELSEDELKDLINIIDTLELDIGEYEDIQVKYNISLYDVKDMLVLDLYRDNNNWYKNNKKVKYTDKLEEWLKKVVK